MEQGCGNVKKTPWPPNNVETLEGQHKSQVILSYKLIDLNNNHIYFEYR